MGDEKEKKPTYLVGDTGEAWGHAIDPRTGKTVGTYTPPEPLPIRPRDYEWDEAFCWLVAKVSKEGLPQGRRKTEAVGRWLTGWFAAKDKYPTRSQVMAYVKQIYDELDKIQ